VDIFIADLHEDGARIGEQIARDGESVSEVSEVAVDAVVPGVAEGFDLLRLARDVANVAVLHVAAGGGPLEVAVEPDAVSELLDRTGPHAHGARLGLAKLAIAPATRRPPFMPGPARPVMRKSFRSRASRASTARLPVVGPTFVDVTEGGRKLRCGARLWTVAVATFKSETCRFLRLERPTDEDLAQGAIFPPGFAHLPRGVEAEWVKQLAAEQLVTIRTKRGFTRLDWQKLRERNEALDCRIYARAAAWIVGADRWAEAKWRDLEDQIGPAPDDGGGLRPDDETTSVTAGRFCCAAAPT
jgi:hypothetical protein